MKIIYLLITIFLICTILYLCFCTDLICLENEGLRDIVNYSLGDCINRDPHNTNFNRLWYRLYFNNTIADQYYRNTNKTNDYKTLHKIVSDRTKDSKIPDQDSLIIHLRIGDVIDIEYTGEIDKILHAKGSHPDDYIRNYNYFDQKIANYEKIKLNKQIILVGGYRMNLDHSRSEEYIEKLKKHFESKGYTITKRIDKGDPDEDFIYVTANII